MSMLEDGPRLDNVKLMDYHYEGDYAQFGERHWDLDYNHGGNDATIGIIAHELGHAALGLYDLYDTDLSSEGIGDFGLMGGGNWARKAGEAPGTTPVHMTGWSKVYAGFVLPETIGSQTNVAASATSDNSYKLYKIETGKTGEYFLVENRANRGYDKGLYVLHGAGSYEGGLSILHVDDNLLGICSYNNTCNDNENHKMVDIEEANNAGLDDKIHMGDKRNLFYTGNQDAFTATTSPDSKRYDGHSSGISITNISARGDVMYFDLEKN
jgi:hypothetical protein